MSNCSFWFKKAGVNSHKQHIQAWNFLMLIVLCCSAWKTKQNKTMCKTCFLVQNKNRKKSRENQNKCAQPHPCLFRPEMSDLRFLLVFHMGIASLSTQFVGGTLSWLFNNFSLIFGPKLLKLWQCPQILSRDATDSAGISVAHSIIIAFSSCKVHCHHWVCPHDVRCMTKQQHWLKVSSAICSDALVITILVPHIGISLPNREIYHRWCFWGMWDLAQNGQCISIGGPFWDNPRCPCSKIAMWPIRVVMSYIGGKYMGCGPKWT
jgi:hypothetical protein